MYRDPLAHAGLYWCFCFLQDKTQKRALWITHSSTSWTPVQHPSHFFLFSDFTWFPWCSELSGHSTLLSRPSEFLLTFSTVVTGGTVGELAQPPSCHRAWLSVGFWFQNHSEHVPSVLRQAHLKKTPTILHSLTFCSLLHLRNLLIAPPTPQKCTLSFFSFGRMTGNLGIDPFHGLQLIFDPSHHYYWSNLLVSASYRLFPLPRERNPVCSSLNLRASFSTVMITLCSWRYYTHSMGEEAKAEKKLSKYLVQCHIASVAGELGFC